MKNEFQLRPDDPRLTAYALGELDPDESAAMEAALQTNQELRATVDDIRAMATRLETALEAEAAIAAEPAGEAAPAPAETAPAPLMAGPASQSQADEYAPVNGRGHRPAPGRLLHFPHLYYIVGGVAAACFAILAAFYQPPAAAPKRTYQVVDLRGGAAPTAPAEPAMVAVALPAVTAPTQEEPLAPSGLGLLDQVEQRQNKAELRLLPSPPPGAVTLGSGVAPEANRIVLSSQPAKERSAVDSAAWAKGDAQGGPKLSQAGGSANAVGAVTVPSRAAAGSAGSPAKNAAGSADGDVVMLSPFVLSESRDSGLLASSSIGGYISPTRTLSFNGAAMAPYSATDLFPGPRSRTSLPEFPLPASPRVTHNTETYAFVRDNDFLSATQNPLSTFSIDVDTASYANVRRFLQSGRLPPADAVRIEELINYFPYRYAPPAADAAPFAASMEVADAPWAPTHRLVRIGLKGREVTTEARPAANLVFLLDVSGSMNQPNKLPLVKESMRLLLGKLRPDDRVAIVTYAGTSGLALPSTRVSQSREIIDAIDTLRAGGSTNGAMGIQLAYDIAKANFVKDGVNRVILCTDGDFNVGVTSQGELVRLVEEKAKSGVFLTVLGFGMGNLKDSTLELLADKGNGHYGYIDTQREAEKLLVDQVSGTLVTIAKDVKIQVDFNPAKVASYRLIGYENRMLKKEDFNNDKVDAGEIGAGHTVTALYEVIPAGAAENAGGAEVQDSKYVPRFVAPKLPAAIADELLTVRVRYKEPAADVSRKLEFPLKDEGGDFANASADFKFTSALAAFGMILRDSPHKGRATIGQVIEWAAAGAASALDDPRGYRAEFLDLARRAQTLLGK